MRWMGFWWGTVILADTEMDRQMLESLSQQLPQDAANSYGEGKMEIGNGPFYDSYNDIEKKWPQHCVAYLVFHR